MSILGRIQALTAVAAGTSVILIPSVRKKILDIVGPYLPRLSWKTVAIILAILNVKNLPFVWHFRIIGTLLYHLYVQPTKTTPQMLFLPSITTIRTPLAEIDYNGHKSNSTYFSDFDQARFCHVTALLRHGILNAHKRPEREIERYREALGKPDLKEVPQGIFTIALGAVSCHFKKEVQPYQKVEIWTRLLSWDRKWLYWVSHVVRAGTIKPESYALQPWKRGRLQKAEGAKEAQARIDKAKKVVIAVSVAKYVVKKGRLTIPPEIVLQDADMLPPKPSGAPPAYKVAIFSKASDLSPPVALDSTDVSGTASPAEEMSMPNGNVLEESLFPSHAEEDWTWERIEVERMKGLKFAEHFAALDGLYDTFDGDGPAMGKWRDIFSL